MLPTTIFWVPSIIEGAWVAGCCAAMMPHSCAGKGSGLFLLLSSTSRVMNDSAFEAWIPSSPPVGLVQESVCLEGREDSTPCSAGW